MTRPTPFATLLLTATVLLFAGCHTTVVQPVQPAAQPTPQPDYHHDNHPPPPPPVPDHRYDQQHDDHNQPQH